ncbi:MAG TPA: cell division protein FtsQ/DivIB [Solirubrobacterales bacterium]|nr:cell division protein FtsQ/DivIB [Solirubrobacterales bacterium]
MSRRAIAVLVGVFLVAAAVYWFGFRQKSVEANVQVPILAAAIGEGDEAVGVAGNGAVVRWLSPPDDPPLPRLPLAEVPKGGKVRGTALEQVRVLAAVPDQLRPYVESSYFGESGVDVMLTSGIELRFGDASQARRKWKAVAAVLADPSVTSLSYVDVHAPTRPAYEESGSELPPAP